MTDDQQAESADELDAAEAEAAEDVDADAEGAEEESGLQQGDFVRLAYTMRTIPDDDDDEEGMVVDTTDAEVAEEADIDTDEYEFEPRIIILGEGHVFEAVDEALVGSEVGDAGTVTIPAAEAFGEVDEDEIRTVSASKIDEDDRYPGAQVQIDGEQGRIETIIGGRARVNFNHPLAGEDLEYDYEILEVIDDRTEKAKGLFGLYLQQTPDLWIQTDEVEEEVEVESDDDDDDEDAEPEYETETVEKETLYIEATPQMTMNQQWLFSKQQIAQDVMNRLDLDRVIVQETIDGMGGMMGGMGGAAPEDIEEAMDDVDLDDVDVDADEIADELDADLDDE
ncbi:FKBP-type peptidyl-prolyl cis-trans isomerase [Salinigranum halophilum]|uniref:FKBP-type peptidyl-prolyl cis-trans isomerase n=1 Tax=Salinigranum halophilum TaxID=2565931 RepID=UPI0010A75C34|nr:peptidylprolyl isomerase [Salinigranum halophilum]